MEYFEAIRVIVSSTNQTWIKCYSEFKKYPVGVVINNPEMIRNITIQGFDIKDYANVDIIGCVAYDEYEDILFLELRGETSVLEINIPEKVRKMGKQIICFLRHNFNDNEPEPRDKIFSPSIVKFSQYIKMMNLDEMYLGDP